jgi:glycosyltransferase involved in cell wall biosynthesis
MRVAEVAPPWLRVPPEGYGGIELVVGLLADGLAERGHDTTLFATGDSQTKARLEFAFLEAPGPDRINDPVLDTVHALHAFRDPSAFDVYHVHAPFSGLAMGAALEVPLVHTIHGPLTPEMSILYGLVGDRARYVAISRAQASGMTELPRVDVVHNGIDLEQYRFNRDKEDFLLFLGRAAPEKGLHRAVMAAREAGLPLVVAVKVAHREEVRHWEHDVLPILPKETRVLREINHEDKVDLLSRARALLFPIDWDEPFGLVMVEAMACGTPVLATPRGAAPEVVADGETGFILPVDGYPQAAVEALRRLSEIEPAACRARVRDRFSKEAMIDGYEAVFRDVAGV